MDTNDIQDVSFEELFRAIAKLQTATEVRKFMRDLCTRSELAAMSERWQIVRYLKEGVPYRIIAEKTGGSTATITRVAQWLNHGTGGYKLALERSPHRRHTHTTKA